MRVVVAMTTADRSPRRNYVGGTLSGLLQSSPTLRRENLHLFATAPDVRWLRAELDAHGIPESAVTLHVPSRKLTRNENGHALLLGAPRSGWLLHLEDDLTFCRDFVGSVRRWLARYASDDYRCYSFCTFRGKPDGEVEAWLQPKNSWGALAVAMRAAHAFQFAAWVSSHIASWRAGMSEPWRVSGFDMMLRTWAGGRFLASHPSFVQHAGDESLTHAFRNRPVTRSPFFAGKDWSYCG